MAAVNQPDRDVVLAAFSSMVGLAGLLLALTGFLFTQYDVLKPDTTADPARLIPFRVTLVGLLALVIAAAFGAALALAWLIPVADFRYPLWLVASILIATPILGAVALKLRW
jgi:hypothetical protein